MYNIFIEGDRNLFVSKSAVDNFKKTVKSTYNTETFNKDGLAKYLKDGYKFKMDVYNSDLKFTIIEKDKNIKTIKLQELREKIKMKTRARTNYHVKQSKGLVPQEIVDLYTKLTKNYNVPIPSPYEIFEKPEEHKGVIKMVLGNQMMKSLPKSHPYVKYFTLIAQAIGVDENTQIEESDMPIFPENVTANGVVDKLDFSKVDNDKLKELLMSKVEADEKQTEQTSKLTLEANTDTEDEEKI